ncbi:MAG: U32 family peptidase [Gordonibacter sp.]|uniref:U32 family peptidase n=1 Tax=Gordonibacter sp. TaxID=1968902 RepID=UPI002FCB6775
MSLSKGKRLRTSDAPELLAPAGGRAQLEAAVRFGADAVYLACDRFGMRQRAENFSLDDLPGAVAFAHAHGAAVHVALNTSMDADDLATLPAYCEVLAAAKADAFIVGDLGALRVAQRHAPGVELHASTQANVCNAEAARVWHELGARRVVCAREMSIAEIARLRADTPADLEIEAFVHGALCMAVSGRCLLSSVMAGRSANKGHCTQPCRWSYALVEEKRPGEFIPIEEDVRGTYVMSAQDLCMIEHLDDLAAAGVGSFKIEGRNKKAFYAATVVHAYRSVLDGADPATVAGDLRAVSHRPYSTGFYYGMAQQSSELDGYLKECLHAATVQSCVPAGDGTWRVAAACFNRFSEGDRLEVLSPLRAIQSVQVRNLAWLPAPDEIDPHPVPVAVAVANRSAATYSFLADAPLEPGDFLRIRIES